MRRLTSAVTTTVVVAAAAFAGVAAATVPAAGAAGACPAVDQRYTDDPYTIRGTVLDALERPAAGVKVTAYSGEDWRGDCPLGSGVTGTDGAYDFTAPSHTYWLEFSDTVAGRGLQREDNLVAGGVFSEERDLSVPGGANRFTADRTMLYAAPILDVEMRPFSGIVVPGTVIGPQVWEAKVPATASPNAGKAPTLTYAWTRDGQPLNITGKSYRTTVDDIGHSFGVRVYATLEHHAVGSDAVGVTVKKASSRPYVSSTTKQVLTRSKKTAKKSRRVVVSKHATVNADVYSDGTRNPLGQVTVSKGKKVLARRTLSPTGEGTAILTLPRLAVGQHALTVRYVPANPAVTNPGSETAVVKAPAPR